MITEEVKTLVFTLLHQRLVQDNLLKISFELSRRAACHDNSKLSTDEFEGLVAINYIAREMGFGSPEYLESLKSDMVKHHWEVNDHHPEHYERGIEAMSLSAIIEMVCDWRAVAIQKKINFWELLEEQAKRFQFTKEQRYLIDRIVMELLS